MSLRIVLLLVLLIALLGQGSSSSASGSVTALTGVVAGFRALGPRDGELLVAGPSGRLLSVRQRPGANGGEQLGERVRFPATPTRCAAGQQGTCFVQLKPTRFGRAASTATVVARVVSRRVTPFNGQWYLAVSAGRARWQPLGSVGRTLPTIESAAFDAGGVRAGRIARVSLVIMNGDCHICPFSMLADAQRLDAAAQRASPAIRRLIAPHVPVPGYCYALSLRLSNDRRWARAVPVVSNTTGSAVGRRCAGRYADNTFLARRDASGWRILEQWPAWQIAHVRCSLGAPSAVIPCRSTRDPTAEERATIIPLAAPLPSSCITIDVADINGDTWAIGETSTPAPECGNGILVFHRVPTGWTLAIEGSEFACSQLPQAVFEAFLINCLR